MIALYAALKEFNGFICCTNATVERSEDLSIINPYVPIVVLKYYYSIESALRLIIAHYAHNDCIAMFSITIPRSTDHHHFVHCMSTILAAIVFHTTPKVILFCFNTYRPLSQ